MIHCLEFFTDMDRQSVGFAHTMNGPDDLLVSLQFFWRYVNYFITLAFGQLR